MKGEPMKFSVPLVVGGVLLMTAAATNAHHSMPNFWHMDRTVEVEGVVQSVKIINPHPELVLEVTNPDGTMSIWRITGAGNASAMIRNGWTNKSLPQGMKVKVEGHPSQNEAARALLAGIVTKPDGTKVEFGGGGFRGSGQGGGGGRGQQ
jgi:hypothetical protein